MRILSLLFLICLSLNYSCCFSGEICVDKEKFLQVKQITKEVIIEQEDLILKIEKEKLTNDDRKLYGTILLRNTTLLQLIAAIYKLEIDEINSYATNSRKISELITHLTIPKEEKK